MADALKFIIPIGALVAFNALSYVFDWGFIVW